MSHLWPTPNELHERWRRRGAAAFHDFQNDDIDVFVESWEQMRDTLEAVKGDLTGESAATVQGALARLGRRRA